MADAKIDFVDDPDEESTLDFDADEALERKYAKQMRQIHPQKIELPISTLKTMIEEQIKLNPDFQRRDRWDTRKQSRFVESIIMNVPVPPVFLGEDKYGSYVVLDGRQRLTAIYEFLRGSYALEKLEVWKELNDMRYSDLEDKGLAPTIKRRFIPAVLLLRESSPEVKYDVFDRLNTGGVPLNAMEIRNAVFQGKFNRLLHDLSDNQIFRELWEIPQNNSERKQNTLYSNMRDIELVLRFFALRNPAEIRKSFKWWLGHYLETRNALAESDEEILQNDTRAFVRAVESIKRVFGTADAFVRPDDLAKKSKSAPLADAIMVSFSRIDSTQIDDAIAGALKTALKDLVENNEEFKNSITTGTNGKGAIATRIARMNEIVDAHANHILI
ncbi:DUF262 domain-containing protein [Burkholderia cenocepacia]|uniref:DUF262 domain-containing protein n=1 Tax=Burkholderia cenocepacia TaxID=95486 RepID=A0ABD4UR97_9BURK|nr:DUF262 domain-containing protein [Burkholderia cenocepacia]MCW3700999.1 DUF262 domain-containing protein [Burkholderia cenocepacia]MCW3708891.1 DUF262 domain-containing protein [Burkholderia cenocepacia]MCW3716893.1 DUF262 domain-containing protein [Burkholderia cenocepacia]MCW3724887.1 DUF262 domain-containing protein [Burkholderia cenocepacia]MCW3732893.1 DUF262 domain-containing protein [Burkholderia cenocepacia]